MLELQTYMIQIELAFRPSRHPLCYAFVTDVFERLDEDSRFLKRVALMTRLPSICQSSQC
jgi:hypothetical protein